MVHVCASVNAMEVYVCLLIHYVSLLMRYVYLYSVPECIVELTSLQRLDLTNNSISG